MTRPAGRARPVPGTPPPAPPRRQRLGVLEITGVVMCCVSAVLAALISVLLTPLYWGSVLVPVSVVVAIASNLSLPRVSRQLGGSMIFAVLPYGIWLISVIVLGMSRPEGDVLLPGGSGAQPWVTYGMLLAGGIAGGVTLLAPGSFRPGRASDPPPDEERR
jgi:hypothetical protein